MSFRDDWSLGLFSCLSEKRVTADICLCFPCNIGRQWSAIRGTEDSMSPLVCIWAAVMPPCANCFLRAKVAEKYNLREGIVVTGVVGTFLPFCSAVQTYHELNVRGTFPGSTLPRGCYGPHPKAMGREFVGGYAPATSRSCSQI